MKKTILIGIFVILLSSLVAAESYLECQGELYPITDSENPYYNDLGPYSEFSLESCSIYVKISFEPSIIIENVNVEVKQNGKLILETIEPTPAEILGNSVNLPANTRLHFTEELIEEEYENNAILELYEPTTLKINGHEITTNDATSNSNPAIITLKKDLSGLGTILETTDEKISIIPEIPKVGSWINLNINNYEFNGEGLYVKFYYKDNFLIIETIKNLDYHLSQALTGDFHDPHIVIITNDNNYEITHLDNGSKIYLKNKDLQVYDYFKIENNGEETTKSSIYATISTENEEVPANYLMNFNLNPGDILTFEETDNILYGEYEATIDSEKREPIYYLSPNFKLNLYGKESTFGKGTSTKFQIGKLDCNSENEECTEMITFQECNFRKNLDTKQGNYIFSCPTFIITEELGRYEFEKSREIYSSHIYPLFYVKLDEFMNNIDYSEGTFTCNEEDCFQSKQILENELGYNPENPEHFHEAKGGTFGIYLENGIVLNTITGFKEIERINGGYELTANSFTLNQLRFLPSDGKATILIDSTNTFDIIINGGYAYNLLTQQKYIFKSGQGKTYTLSNTKPPSEQISLIELSEPIQIQPLITQSIECSENTNLITGDVTIAGIHVPEDEGYIEIINLINCQIAIGPQYENTHVLDTCTNCEGIPDIELEDQTIKKEEEDLIRIVEEIEEEDLITIIRDEITESTIALGELLGNQPSKITMYYTPKDKDWENWYAQEPTTESGLWYCQNYGKLDSFYSNVKCQGSGVARFNGEEKVCSASTIETDKTVSATTCKVDKQYPRGRTSTGTSPTPKRTIACPRNADLQNFDEVYIDFGESHPWTSCYKCEDVGGAVKVRDSQYHFDVYVGVGEKSRSAGLPKTTNVYRGCETV